MAGAPNSYVIGNLPAAVSFEIRRLIRVGWNLRLGPVPCDDGCS